MFEILLAQDRVFVDKSPSRLGMIALIVLPLALAYGIFIALDKRDPSDPLHKLKWAGFLPLLVGVILGALNARNMGSYLYQQANLIGGNMRVLHYVSLVIPILGMIGLALLARKKNSGPRYDF